MALRLHLTPADLGRVRVALHADQLVEVALSMRILRMRSAPPPYHNWWRDTRELLSQRPDILRHYKLLLSAVRDDRFFDLAADRSKADAAPPVSALRERSLTAVPEDEHARALRDYFLAVLLPLWDVVEEAVAADTSVRLHHLATGGVERLLGELPSPLRWTGAGLKIGGGDGGGDGSGDDVDVDVAGNGLTLMPAYFCWRDPIVLGLRHGSPMLVYPVAQPGRTRTGGAEGRNRLVALIGEPRTDVMHLLRVPSSTTGVARRTDMSIGSASKHIAVLRQAGLVSSTRHGRTMMHSLTPVGHALLTLVATPATSTG